MRFMETLFFYKKKQFLISNFNVLKHRGNAYINPSFFRRKNKISMIRNCLFFVSLLHLLLLLVCGVRPPSLKEGDLGPDEAKSRRLREPRDGQVEDRFDLQ